MPRFAASLVAFASLGIASCASTGPGGSAASATLRPAAGTAAGGVIAFVSMGDGVHARGRITGLAPGSVHAFHIHENGDCSAPDFSSAGGHYNPTGSAHGRIGAGAHHAGDNDNLVADGNGVAVVDAHFSGTSLGGDASVVGRSVVLHADPDDYISQPAGNAGKRIACGVILAR